MKFGISVGNGGAFGSANGIDTCLDIARRAEELGYDSVWVHDHLVIPERIDAPYPYDTDGFPVPWDTDFYEPLVLMSALAAITTRVRIGSSVLVIPHRHPAVTAKMLAFADRLSGGRIVFGVGAGWMRDEFEALGLPAEHFDRRGAVTNEYLCAIKELWTNTGPSSYTGEFVEFHDVGAFPKPMQKPHPPIIIGGSGEHALRRASRLGNGYQAVSQTPTELAASVKQLRALCGRDRRDPDELEISLAQTMQITRMPLGTGRAPLFGSLEQVAEDLRAYGIAGLDHLISTPLLEAESELNTDAERKGGGDLLDRVYAGMEYAARELLPAFQTRTLESTGGTA
jgi:probable F420-dependent oxidoreductase